MIDNIQELEELIDHLFAVRKLVQSIGSLVDTLKHLIQDKDISALDKAHHGKLCLLLSGAYRTMEDALYNRDLTREVRSLYAIRVHSSNNLHPIIFERYFCEKWHEAVTAGAEPPSRPAFFNAATLRSHVTRANIPQTLSQAIHTDDVATFEILHTTLRGHHMTRSTAKIILANRAYRILMSRPDQIEKVLQPEEMLFYCVSSLDDNALPLIDFLEQRHPGLVANARDLYGNNALWYGLHRFGSIRCQPKTEQRLLELGCNPNATNCLDLSYRSMIEAQDYLNSL